LSDVFTPPPFFFKISTYVAHFDINLFQNKILESAQKNVTNMLWRFLVKNFTFQKNDLKSKNKRKKG